MTNMNNPAAGWYPDPSNGASERLWDGNTWTDNVRPKTPAAPPPQPDWGSSGMTPPIPPSAYPSYGQGAMQGNPYGQSSWAAKPVSFGEAMRRGFTLWTIRGRASRSEFWWWVLGSTLVNLTLAIVLRATPYYVENVVERLVGLFIFVATLKISIRRYHDRGMGGGWAAGIYAGIFIGLALLVAGTDAVIEAQLLRDETATARAAIIWLLGVLFLAAFGIWNHVIHCLRGKPERNRFDA